MHKHQRAKSKEQRAKNKEQRTKSKEQRTKNKEQITLGITRPCFESPLRVLRQKADFSMYTQSRVGEVLEKTKIKQHPNLTKKTKSKKTTNKEQKIVLSRSFPNVFLSLRL